MRAGSRRAIGAALVLLFILVLTTAIFDQARGGMPRVLPDTGASLSQVVVSLTSARRASLHSAALTTALGRALAPTAELVALSNDPEAFSVQYSETPRPFRLVALPRDRDFTIWPQDPFLVLVRADGSRQLRLSASFARADDDLMAQTLANELGLDISRSAFAFEGGNVLADEDWIYIGANTIRYNAQRLELTDTAVARALADELGGQVMVIGSLPQPVAHIDMMLTPLGHGRLVVADLAAGAALAASALRDDPPGVARFERDLAARRPTGATSAGSDTVPQLLGATARVVDAAAPLVAYFDVLSDSLRARGFEVFRMPLLFDPALDAPGEETEYRGVLAYPMLTYNNVLLEQSGERRRVYLPQYGFAAMDDAARQQWESLGYEVVAVGNYALSALYGGALRCSAKVLARARP